VVLKRKGSNKVLVCHRTGMGPAEGWQFPQGGIDPHRDLLEETRRELLEEIGTDSIVVLGVSERVYCYDFPAPITKDGTVYHGQCHRWVVATLDPEVSVLPGGRGAEFDAHEWVTPAEVLERIVGFKRTAYVQAIRDLGIAQNDCGGVGPAEPR
jgi:putative (di)nucleoside polyphosphate hydrolase